MNRNQVFCVILIVALIGNAVIHLVHPAYRRYNDICRAFDTRMTAFEDSFRSRLMPVVSNIVSVIERGDIGAGGWSGIGDSPSVVTTALSSVAATADSAVPVFGRDVPDRVALSYGSLNGVPFVLVNNDFPLYVGDTLFGEKILSIDRTCLKCEFSTFFYAPALVVADTKKRSDEK